MVVGNQRLDALLPPTQKARTERNINYLRGGVLFTLYYHMCAISMINISCKNISIIVNIGIS